LLDVCHVVRTVRPITARQTTQQQRGDDRERETIGGGVIRRFLDVSVAVEHEGYDVYRVSVGPAIKK